MKLLLSIILCLLVVISARATDITIVGASFAGYQGGGTSATVRFYASEDFTTSTGEVVAAGSPTSSTGFYRILTCTVSGSTLTCPSIILPSTDDSPDVSDARWTAVVLDNKGAPQRRGFPVADFQLPHTFGVSITWAQIRTFNAAPIIRPAPGYLTGAQVAVLIAGQQFANPATTMTRGVAKSSVDVADPVFVEMSDPRVAAASTTNRGTVTTTTATSQAASTDDSRLAYVTPKQYGAIGDGSSHLLTSGDVTAHAAGTQYPWVGVYTVGGDTLDYIGLQEAFYHAFAPTSIAGSNTPVWGGNAGSKLNKAVFIPGGEYRLNQTLIIKKTVGGHIYGAGDIVTTLTETAALPLISTNNLSYSLWEGIDFRGTAVHANAVFEMDRDATDLTPSSASNQKNTFIHCLFDGGTVVAYGMRIATTASNSQGSENAFYSCTFTGTTQSGVSINDFNALNNNFYNCDFIANPVYGIYVLRGTFNVFGGAFENGFYPANQADIYIATSANDGCSIYGARTESAVFLNNASDKRVNVDGLHQNVAANVWTLNTITGLGQLIRGTNANGDGKIYRASIAGTTSGTEPVWPGTGSIVDGTVTWTIFDYDTVTSSNLSLTNSIIQGGRVNIGLSATTHVNIIQGNEFTRADWMKGEYVALANSFIYVNANLVKIFGNSGTVTAYKTGSDGSKTNEYAAKNMLNLGGSTALLFSAGAGGVPADDVGFIRGNTSSGARAGNSTQVIGGLTLHSYTYAQLAVASPANGTVAYCSDCDTPASPGAAISSAGDKAGARVEYVRGGWKAY